VGTADFPFQASRAPSDERRLSQAPLKPLDGDVYTCNRLIITGVISMRISDAESLVMDALWRESPLTAEDIAAAVGPEQNWSDKTVKTLLNRLLTKKAIAAARDGRRYLYSPLVARADYIQDESRGLIDRLFDGKLAPLVSHFAQTNQLTAEDIAELKRLIAELDDDQ
jgi:BlaI family transcriptional regulator, penicillinase repressor